MRAALREKAYIDIPTILFWDGTVAAELSGLEFNSTVFKNGGVIELVM